MVTVAQDKKRCHYLRAWPLLAYAFICYFLTGTVSSIVNVVQTLLNADRGWDAGLIAASMSIASLVNVITGVIAGRATIGHSAKRLCFIWGVLYIVGVVCMGPAPALGMFIISLVVANAASSAWGYNTVPVILTNWFPTKKGSVQGFVSMGILLGFFSTFLFTWAYNNFGMAFSTIPFAFIAAMALVLLACGVSDTPEQRGLAPDTMEHIPIRADFDPTQQGNDVVGSAVPRNRARTYLRNPRFLAMGLVLGLQLMYAGGVMVQVVPRLMEQGFSLEEAMFALVISSVCAAAGSFVFGVIGDRFGVKSGVRISFAVGAVAMLINLTGVRPLIYLSLILVGMVVGCGDNWPVGVCAELYGREGFSASFGVMFPLVQLIGAIGPAAIAFIARVNGSYDASYAFCAVMMIVGLITYELIDRHGGGPRQRETRNE
ncbi:MFS transporter [Olsenella sp. AF16-14LB]|nr:MFS transporter [Olsenella sp. AF16-14LB]RGU83785.1 MFS transporter [Olsenella sp. AF15-43LB]